MKGVIAPTAVSLYSNVLFAEGSKKLDPVLSFGRCGKVVTSDVVDRVVWWDRGVSLMRGLISPAAVTLSSRVLLADGRNVRVVLLYIVSFGRWVNPL